MLKSTQTVEPGKQTHYITLYQSYIVVTTNTIKTPHHNAAMLRLSEAKYISENDTISIIEKIL